MSVAYPDALKLIGGLSQTTKMPWWSWSISAEDCITGSKLAKRENTVCSGCYALKGMYVFPNVKVAHKRRHAAMSDPDFVDAFVTVLTQLHKRTRKKRVKDDQIITENRFRWLDAGDLQSVGMLEQINQIALRTPFIDHWLPTRERKIVQDYLDQHGGFAPNLVVRFSMPVVGALPKRRIMNLPYATVGASGGSVRQCPALHEQGNRCLNCDQCWRSSVDINYPRH